MTNKIKLFESSRNPCLTNDGIKSWRQVMESQVNGWLEENQHICIEDVKFLFEDGVVILLIRYVEDIRRM